MTLSMDGHGPAELLITPTVGPAGVSLRLGGEMDVATARHLTEVMRSLPVSLLHEVRLDLIELAFIDAFGLSVLLETRNLISSRGGRLTLHQPRPLLVKLLNVTELAALFDVDPDERPLDNLRRPDRVS